MTKDPGDLEAATGYRPDFPYHDENLLMLDWYASRLERTLRERRARRLLSLGIGHPQLPELGHHLLHSSAIRLLGDRGRRWLARRRGTGKLYR